MIVELCLVLGVIYFLKRYMDANPVVIQSYKQKMLEASKPLGFSAIADNYHSLAEVEEALRKQGLETSKLVVAIDYTRSNEEQGQRTFYGRSLHTITAGSERFAYIPEGDVVRMSGAQQVTADSGLYPGLNPEMAASILPNAPEEEESPESADVVLNPYQQVLRIVGQTLKSFDDDGKIYCVGFGDKQSTDRRVTPFHRNKQPCNGFEEVIDCYNKLTPKLTLSGPTDFTPVIEETIRLVAHSRQYTILLIITDGAVTDRHRTGQAIVKASQYPISIICVGVGDGPFDTMEEYDDELEERLFDNFQFLSYEQTVKTGFVENPAATFAMHALMEVPEQYAAIKRLGLLRRT